MHKYHYGYLGREVWAAYCECGWTHKQQITFDAFDAKRVLFVAFIEHLEGNSEDS